MPLKAILDSSPMCSFELSDAEWADLRQSYRSRQLVMPCCNAQAIPKVSQLGLRFFAHKRHGECNTAPESEAHLRVKWIIASSAIAAGWQAESEVRGKTPDGADWVADVLCTNGKAKVAFEVQLASQTLDDYRIRQARYIASGVRACWLAKRAPRIEERNLPLFDINLVDRDSPVVSTEDFSVPLGEFVQGALTGKLKWLDGSEDKYHYTLEFIWADCWKCKEKVSLIHGMSFKGSTRMLAMVQVAQEHIVDLKALMDDIRKLQGRLPSVALLEFRTSLEKRVPFLASICPYCKSAFSEWYAFTVPYSRRATHGIRMGIITVKNGEGRTAAIGLRMSVGWAWLGGDSHTNGRRE